MLTILFDKNVERFINSLEKPTVAKILRVVDLLQKFDHQLGMPHAKKITSDLFELRIRGKQEIRIFYTYKDDKIVMIHGFIKKSQTTPKHQIEQAKKKLAGLT